MTAIRKACPYSIAAALREGRMSPEEVGVDQIAALATVISSLSISYGVRTFDLDGTVATHWYPDPEVAFDSYVSLREAARGDTKVELVTSQRSPVVSSDFHRRERGGATEIENH